jgi:AAA15 family ATPase/GTPase
MKVQIKSLRVIGCGPLRDVEIDFSNDKGEPRPITLLAGANGSGKTTVLELIAYLSGRLENNTKFIHTALNKRRLTEMLKIEYAELNIEFDNEPITLVYPNKRKTSENNKLIGIIDNADGEKARMLLKSIENQTISRQIDLSIDFIGSIIYIPYRRFLSKVSGNEIRKEETDYQWIYEYQPSETFDGSLDSYLIWLDYAEPETYSKTIQFLNGLNFDGKSFSVIRKELKAIVTTRDGQTHDVAALSSGEQNLLIMLLELHRRLLPNSIVLIDEIENSLHPAFQYKIGNALKKMQKEIPFQLIVTSHSPTFLDIFGRENTLLLTEF